MNPPTEYDGYQNKRHSDPDDRAEHGADGLIVLIGILVNNARFGDLNTRLGETNVRIGELRSHMDTRFEEVKDLWRWEHHRVEEILDARLKHIKER